MTRKEYIKANHQWLAEKAKEEGVGKIGPGVYRKVIASGEENAPQPNLASIVTAHYTGRTIDGKTFDDSRAEGSTPPAFRVRDLIDGWQMALTQMRRGDKWELYIAAEAGYGQYSQPGIPAGSTLVFEIELISVA